MWNNLSQLSVSPLNLVVRGAVVYLSVVLLIRISGKKQMGQLGTTEFVAILLISNAVQNAMNGGDNSLVGGLILASVLIFLSWAISLLTYHWRGMQTIFEGTPTLLVHRGEVIEKHLIVEKITHSELRTMLRKQGIHDLSEIQTAILESDGHLSVTRTTDKAFPS